MKNLEFRSLYIERKKIAVVVVALVLVAICNLAPVESHADEAVDNSTVLEVIGGLGAKPGRGHEDTAGPPAARQRDLTVFFAGEEGYKKARWGMTKEQVKYNFPDIVFKDLRDSATCFQAMIAREKALVFMDFYNNKLSRVFMDFKINTANKDNYLAQFDYLEGLLSEKYGMPESKLRQVDKTLKVPDLEAVSQGKGFYSDRWFTSQSKIVLMLTGDNDALYLSVCYISLSLEEKARDLNRRVILDNL